MIYTKVSVKNHVVENITEITINTFEKKIYDKENFILYLYAKTCKYCTDFEPELDVALGDNGLFAYKIQNDKNDLYRDYLKQQLGERYQGTPAVYFYINGEIYEYVVGTQDRSILKNYIKKYKEDYYEQLKSEE
jgi:thioredoxin-like negative regulator of GroEL